MNSTSNPASPAIKKARRSRLEQYEQNPSLLKQMFGSLAFWLLILCAIAGFCIRRWSRSAATSTIPVPASQRVQATEGPTPEISHNMEPASASSSSQPSSPAPSAQPAEVGQDSDATEAHSFTQDAPGMVSRLNETLTGTDPEQTQKRQQLLTTWANQEPSKAAQWAQSIKSLPDRHNALETVAIAWAGKEPEAAADWAAHLEVPADKTVATLALANEAARTNPAMALDATGALEPSPERDAALLHSASQWASTDAAAAAAWALKTPDDSLKSHLVSAVAIASAEAQPEISAALTGNSLPAGEEQNRTAVAVVQRWAQTSPADAVQWVEQFPDSSARSAATENLFSIWALRDPKACASYIEQMPDGWMKQTASQVVQTAAKGG